MLDVSKQACLPDALSHSLSQGSLYVLDVSPSSLLHHRLLWGGQQPLRTVMVIDLGLPLCDLAYLPGAWDDQVLVSARGGGA